MTKHFIIIVFFLAFLLTGCASRQPQSVNVEDGMIYGKVTIGPLCGGPESITNPCDPDGNKSDAALKGRNAFLYDATQQTQLAGQQLSNKSEYSFTVKPGTYIVAISDSHGNGLVVDSKEIQSFGFDHAQSKRVDVQAGARVELNFDFDTGIR